MNRDLRAAAAAVEAAAGQRGWNTRDLARETGLDAATVGDFLAARRWPRSSTRGAVERALRWPPGYIKRIADGDVPPAVSSSAHERPSWIPPEAEQLTPRDQRVLLAVIRAMLEPDEETPGGPDYSTVQGIRLSEEPQAGQPVTRDFRP
jgi:lambda repressor-like predicted transcriptional regulator